MWYICFIFSPLSLFLNLASAIFLLSLFFFLFLSSVYISLSCPLSSAQFLYSSILFHLSFSLLPSFSLPLLPSTLFSVSRLHSFAPNVFAITFLLISVPHSLIPFILISSTSQGHFCTCGS